MKKTDRSNHSTVFSAEDKRMLKMRIMNSVEKYKRRKRTARYVFAATLALFILGGSGVYLYTENSFRNPYENVLVNYDATSINEVSLILSDKTVQVSEEDSVISYSRDPNRIAIGKTKEVANKGTAAINTIIVPFGRRSQLQLADGTTIWLNAGSKLVYPSQFTEGQRKVYLEGEAVFDVAHDEKHPFIVITKEQEIEVLGTEFNVSSYADENTVQTALRRGKINIHYKSGGFINRKKSEVILPGTVATYNKATRSLSSKAAHIDDYFLWTKGLMLIKNDHLDHILQLLSRHYNVTITLQNAELKHQTFSGYLDLKDDLSLVLENIQESAAFTFENVNHKTIIIK